MTFFLLNWRHIKSTILTYNCLENLAYRNHDVRINCTNSTLVSFTHWVPQGGILGPLLFLTFINHLPLAIVDIFADDTTFSSSVNFFLGTLTLQSPFNRTLTVHTKSYWIEIRVVVEIWLEDSKLIINLKKWQDWNYKESTFKKRN